MNLLPEPSGASHEGKDEGDEWWDVPPQLPVVGSSSVQEQEAEHVTSHVGSPPSQWRLDALGKFASQFPPDYWLNRGRTPFAAAAVGAVPLGTGLIGPVQPVSEPSERLLRTQYGGYHAPGVRPRKRWAPLAAPAVVGLATFASATRPAEGSSAVTYDAATFTFATAAFEASTCIKDVQLSAPAEVVTGWSLVGIAVFVIFIVAAAFATYTVWLLRYVGFRAPSILTDVGVQTERQDLLSEPSEAGLVVRAPREQSGTAAAPPLVLTLANGRCFHVPGCQYTRKTLSACGHTVLKPGIVSFKRCEVCLPNLGKHWGHRPTELSAPAEARGQAPGSSYDAPPPRRPPRMPAEARHRPDPWPTWPASFSTVNYIVILVDQEISSETILQFVGAHVDPNFKWSRRRHWIGIGCGQSCGCCRSEQEEDRGLGCCLPCEDLWYLKGSTKVPVGGSVFITASQQDGHGRCDGASCTPSHVGMFGAS